MTVPICMSADKVMDDAHGGKKMMLKATRPHVIDKGQRKAHKCCMFRCKVCITVGEIKGHSMPMNRTSEHRKHCSTMQCSSPVCDKLTVYIQQAISQAVRRKSAVQRVCTVEGFSQVVQRECIPVDDIERRPVFILIGILLLLLLPSIGTREHIGDTLLWPGIDCDIRSVCTRQERNDYDIAGIDGIESDALARHAPTVSQRGHPAAAGARPADRAPPCLQARPHAFQQRS